MVFFLTWMHDHLTEKELQVDNENEDAIALDMEEAIDDAIMVHGGNPFDWDTRSDFLDDPLGFGDDDDF